MRIRLASLPRRAGAVACLIPSLLAALATAPASAEEQDTAPRCTLSIEAVALQRIGGASRTLVERVPGTVPFTATFTTPGTEAFNSNQLLQGVVAGPKIGLLYRYDTGFSVEASYFNSSTGSASRTIGPDSPADWLVMRAPGAFWQTQDFAYQGMTWSDTTNLYSAEINGRWVLAGGVTVNAVAAAERQARGTADAGRYHPADMEEGVPDVRHLSHHGWRSCR